MWSIRPARADEGPALSALALRAKASWGYSPELVAAFAAELTVDREDLARAHVVDVDGEPAGFYALEDGPGAGAELAFLFVAPELHRRGIGAALMRHAMAQARAQGHRTLTIQGDPHATTFYESLGARRIGERESASVPGRTLPLFELPL